MFVFVYVVILHMCSPVMSKVDIVLLDGVVEASSGVTGRLGAFGHIDT